MPGIDWSMAGDGQYDYLKNLQGLGQAQLQQQQLAQDRFALGQKQQQAAGRSGLQSLIAAGDYQGAQTKALGFGDLDFADAIGKMSLEHQKQISAESEVMGRAAMALKNVPVEKRSVVFAGMRPQLRGVGFSDGEIDAAGGNLNDDTLDGYIGMSQSIRDQLQGKLTNARVADIGIDNNRADRRLDWDIQDDEQDNTRADRNVDSEIGYRSQRVDLTRRGQDMTDARGRAGQDVTRRGQEMTDARIRSGAGKRAWSGGLGTVPGTASLPVTVTTPDQARLLPKGTYFQTPDGRVKIR